MKREELHILDYLEGRLSEDERMAFELELENSLSLQKEVDDLRFLLNTINHIKDVNKVNTIARWKKLSFKLYLLKIRSKTLKSVQRLVVIAFVPLLLFVYYLNTQIISNSFVEQSLVEVKSAFGVVSKITLPDSSIVYLNSGSSLLYPIKFQDDSRSVFLSGEAYFIVKSDPANQFKVKISDDLTVSAYGTAFNVNAYKEQGWVSTALTSGNVSINKQLGTSSSVNIIRPGELAVIDKNTKEINISTVNLYSVTAWKDGKIVFRRAKMPEIIYRLSKHFNVEIELRDNILNQYEFSATFTTETLSEILNLIGKSSPIKWHFVEPKQQSDQTYTKRKVIISLLR
ncbi:FecR family protein [Massilibacteroides vaginae]|uniref:FecR family protein n=1 Tax=Massilibacteroides vaginae TaxID=1673718 RepID=UPI000A1CDF89|nr:FecR domain-containing protein [Massilibacteroides vaginae]